MFEVFHSFCNLFLERQTCSRASSFLYHYRSNTVVVILIFHNSCSVASCKLHQSLTFEAIGRFCGLSTDSLCFLLKTLQVLLTSEIVCCYFLMFAISASSAKDSILSVLISMQSYTADSSVIFESANLLGALLNFVGFVKWPGLN